MIRSSSTLLTLASPHQGTSGRYSGFDCAVPICRHKQELSFVNPLNPDDRVGPPPATGEVMGCLNGGICGGRDDCDCTREQSILHTIYDDSVLGVVDAECSVDVDICCDAVARQPTGMSECEEYELQNPDKPPRPDCCYPKTGWEGSDCSIPICAQGSFDPICMGVTPGGEGCYRCANGGNCTAPDFCHCTPEYEGCADVGPLCRPTFTSGDPHSHTHTQPKVRL